MKKYLLTVGACAMAMTGMAQSQKISASLDLQMSQVSAIAAHRAPGKAAPCLSVFVHTSQPELVAAAIKGDGYYANVLWTELLTAQVPISYIETLEANELVTRLEGVENRHPDNDLARADVGVDKIHNGTELETPYTGKGVLVGIIDDGFKWNHIAFKKADGTSRFKWIWERKNYKDSTLPKTKRTTTIPDGEDLWEGGVGHATHVTGIAAGSRIIENDYYGVATEADLVGISTSFDDAELLEDIREIAQYAQEQNQPCVINMSLGAVGNPGDGTSTYSKEIDKILKQYPNTAMVVSAGNSGDSKCHATYTFKKAGEKVYLFVNEPEVNKFASIWSDKADNQMHFKVTTTLLDLLFETSLCDVSMSNNHFEVGRQRVFCGYNEEQAVQLQSKDFCALMIEITSLEDNVTFHAWAADSDSFSQKKDYPFNNQEVNTLPGDNNPCINEVGEMPIMIGNYVTRNIFPLYVTPDTPSDYSKDTFVGYLSESSSRGPSLDSRLKKPTVSAPGTFLISSLNEQKPKNAGGDGTYENFIVSNVVRDGKNNYYAAYSGTSMSTPLVTGCIALWKQAYPQLTTAQIEEIIKKTAVKDDYTKHISKATEENSFDSDGWSRHWGYGKFDAYSGLKEVLRLKQSAHIQSMAGSTEPVSMQKRHGEWRILFNNSEPQADIYLYDIQGRMVARQHYTSLASGQEVVLPLSAYDGGAYTVRIKTSKSDTARKLLR